MAEPARKALSPEDAAPAEMIADEEIPGIDIVQRWVEGPDGRMELLELPLTPELFLDPQDEDKIIQHPDHHKAVHSLFDRVDRYFESDPDVMVLSDAKHLLGPGLPGPGPDISVIRGPKTRDFTSFDLAEQGVVPCLIVEVVSASNARIRRTDEVDKVALYERVGIPEYMMIEMPRAGNARQYRLKGCRLGPGGRYRSLEPDAQGRFHSRTTGLLFAVPPGGKGIDLFDSQTGERLLTAGEHAQQARQHAQQARQEAERARQEAERATREEKARKTAEARARRESEARLAAEERSLLDSEARLAAEEKVRQAEEEMARLRAELERLKVSGG